MLKINNKFGWLIVLIVLLSFRLDAKEMPSVTLRVQKVDLEKTFAISKFVDLYAPKSKAPKKAFLSDLAQLKSFEIQSDWKNCQALAPQVFSRHKSLQGWIALTWLHCSSKFDAKKQVQTLDSIGKVTEIFQNGPWSGELSQTWLVQNWVLLNSMLTGKKQKLDKKNQQLIEQRIDQMMEYAIKQNASAAGSQAVTLAGTANGFGVPYAHPASGPTVNQSNGVPGNQGIFSKEQKAQLFQWLGELAGSQNKSNQAHFFSQEALALRGIKGEAGITEKPNGKVQAGGTKIDEDDKLDEKIRLALTKMATTKTAQMTYDLIVKDIVSLLNQFPASRSARRWKDKPLEIYNSVDEADVESKILNEMSAADATRVLEWAQTLHRRQDYEGAFILAQKAYQKNPQAPGVVSSLWVAGRSAHFLGKYNDALNLYNTLITVGKGSEESIEAMFRSGLIYFRIQDYAKAAGLFERLLQASQEQGRDRYDLSGRYWLVRSLEMTNKEQAQKWSQSIAEKYPFTYYGLRLNSEAHNGKWIWPEVSERSEPDLQSEKISKEIFLVGAQKKSWQRFLELTEAGWISEAQREYQEGPVIKDPRLKIFLAEKLAQRGHYFLAIRLINEAMDMAPSLRRAEILKVGYPQAFDEYFKKAADQNHVDVNLLRSLTRQESGFNMRAVSSSNAMGLMQMIPPTAQDIAKKLGLKVELPEDMFRPELNIKMGASYVAQMIEQFHGNVPFALAAYNAGPQRMKTWLEGREQVRALVDKPSELPADELWIDELPWTETSLYVKSILRNLLIYKAFP